MKDLESVKARIRKILALARDDAATDGEVTAAMETAQRMLNAYHLTEEDLKEGDRQMWSFKRSTIYSDGAMLMEWEGYLAVFICDFIGGVQCFRARREAVRTEHDTLKFDANGNTETKTPLTFYGVAEDVELAKEAFAEFQLTIASMARMRFGGFKQGDGRRYAEGFVIGMQAKLRESRAKDRLSSPQTTALIVRRDEIVEAKTKAGTNWLAETNGIKIGKAKRKTRARTRRNDAAAGGRGWREGYVDGQSTDVNVNRRDKLSGGHSQGYLED